MTPLSVPETVAKIWTRQEYEQAVAQSVYGPDDKIELIEGVIVPKMPQNDLHRSAVGAMQEALGRSFQKGYWLCIQLPLALGGRSMPEPDLAVVIGSWRDYRSGTPTAEKAMMYARGGIRDYWIVNLVERVLEVRRGSSEAGYRETLRLTATQTIAPLAAEATFLAVADLLP